MFFGLGGINQGLEDVRRRRIEDEDRAYADEIRPLQSQLLMNNVENSNLEMGLKKLSSQDALQKRDWTKAMTNFVSTDGSDIQSINETLSKYEPGKALTRNKDTGGYIASFPDGNGNVQQKELSKTDVAALIHYRIDPTAQLKGEQAAAEKMEQRNYDAGLKLFDANAAINAQAQKYEQDKGLAQLKGDEDRKTEAMKSGEAGKPTNSAKEYKELLNLDVPKDAARTIAYSGSIKSVSDPDSGATILIDLSRNGEEVGRFERQDPDDYGSPMQWKTPRDPNKPYPWQEGVENQRSFGGKKIEQGGLPDMVTQPTRTSSDQTPQSTLPPQAASALKEGVVTKFRNGQVWTLRDGQPVRVK